MAVPWYFFYLRWKKSLLHYQDALPQQIASVLYNMVMFSSVIWVMALPLTVADLSKSFKPLQTFSVSIRTMIPWEFMHASIWYLVFIKWFKVWPMTLSIPYSISVFSGHSSDGEGDGDIANHTM
jgi:hypothetical protein